MIGTLFREDFCAEPMNEGICAKSESELYSIYYKHFHDVQVNRIKKYYPFNDIKDKIWKYPTIFDERHAMLISTTQQTDCKLRCGSIAQTEILSTNELTKDNKFPVYFYQYGNLYEPWDAVTHGFDIPNLFGNGETIPFKSMFWNEGTEEFSKITMRFFGDYIKGNNPVTNDNKLATVQNGYMIYVVDGVRILELSELDAVKKRCELFMDNYLGEDIFRNVEFCQGTVETRENPDEFEKIFKDSMKKDEAKEEKTEL